MVLMGKRLVLTSIAALFLATGTAQTETDALGCFVRTYDKSASGGASRPACHGGQASYHKMEGG